VPKRPKRRNPFLSKAYAPLGDLTGHLPCGPPCDPVNDLGRLLDLMRYEPDLSLGQVPSFLVELSLYRSVDNILKVSRP
jgi:hypothetical protein